MDTPESPDAPSENDGPAESHPDLVEFVREQNPDIQVDQDDLERIVSTVERTRSVQLQAFSGPLPSPQMLAEYEQVVSGSAERLLAQAEKEQSFRHEMVREQAKIEKSGQLHRAIQGYAGQAGAFILVMTVVIVGARLIEHGNDTAGLTSIITAIVVIAVAFITGKVPDLLKAWKTPSEPDGPPE